MAEVDVSRQGYLRRDQRWSELERLRSSNPMYDAVIEEIQGRRIRIGEHWLTDFASCNYLGFDLDPEIIASIEEPVRRWGTHPSWSRLLGNPRLYPQIEEQLTELLAASDTLVLPTITHIHMSVIPVLAGQGAVFVDAQAHKTIYDGCMYARGLGATVQRFRADDPHHLEELLRAAPARASRLACLALPTWLKNHLKVAAPPYLYSGPSPTASLATVLAGLEVNRRRGDEIRADLYRKTRRVLQHVRALGLHTPNTSGTPIIELPLADQEELDQVGRILFDRGIYVTLAAYPLVPKNQVGFRVQVTAANTDDEIDQLNDTLTALAQRYMLREAA